MENRFCVMPTKKVYSLYEIHTSTALRKGCYAGFAYFVFTYRVISI